MSANSGQIVSRPLDHRGVVGEQAGDDVVSASRTAPKTQPGEDAQLDHPPRGARTRRRRRPRRARGRRAPARRSRSRPGRARGRRRAGTRSGARRATPRRCARAPRSATRNEPTSAPVRTTRSPPTLRSGACSAQRGLRVAAGARSSSTRTRRPCPSCAITVPDRAAVEPQPEPVDEHVVEDDVDDVADDQDHQRRPQVPDAAQVALAGERDENAGHAERGDAQVALGEVARSRPRRRAAR